MPLNGVRRVTAPLNIRQGGQSTLPARTVSALIERFASSTAASRPTNIIQRERRGEALRLIPQVVGAMRITPDETTPPGRVREEILRVLAGLRGGTHPPASELVDILLDEMIGLGPLETLRRDPEITDILVNRFDEIYVERAGLLSPADVSFADETHLLSLLHRLVGRAGRRVDQASPVADALLPDGSRLNVVLPPLAIGGPVMSLRRHATRNLSMAELVDAGSVPPRLAALLLFAVRARWNVLVTGGAGAGKTTLLNAISAFVTSSERIITIEDVAELQLRHNHVVRLQSRPASLEGGGEVTLRDLMRQTLRMRGDRVIVGEVRGPEAWDMLTAMNTGADGSLGTLHANGPTDAMLRLEGLVTLANPSLGIAAIRANISAALDLVVHVARFVDGTRRVTDIAEIVGSGTDGVGLRPLYAHASRRHDGSEGSMDYYAAPDERMLATADAAGLADVIAAFAGGPVPSV